MVSLPGNFGEIDGLRDARDALLCKRTVTEIAGGPQVPLTMTDDKLWNLAKQIYIPSAKRGDYEKALLQLDSLDDVDRAKLAELRHEFTASIVGVEGEHSPPEILFWLLVETLDETGRQMGLTFIAEFTTASEAIEAGDRVTDLGRLQRFTVQDSFMHVSMYDSKDPLNTKK